MKWKMFRTSLATLGLLVVSGVVQAQSCGVEGCDGKACKCHSKNCDDNGLLEIVNQAASTLEDRIARMIPDRPVAPCKSKSGSCDCQHHHHGEHLVHAKAPAGLPKVPTGIAVEPIAPPQPMGRKTETAAPVVPPKDYKPEVVPVPDSQVNPFRDETTRNMRSVPTSPANYLKPIPTYGTTYDPQANNEPKRIPAATARPLHAGATSELSARSSSRKSPMRGISDISISPASATVEIPNPYYVK